MPYADEAKGSFRESAKAATAVANIADPATATAEDVANKVNALLAALRAAGLLKS